MNLKARSDESYAKLYADYAKLRELRRKAWVAPVCTTMFAAGMVCFSIASFSFTVANTGFKLVLLAMWICAMVTLVSVLTLKNSRAEQRELDNSISDRLQSLLPLSGESE